MPAMPKNRLSLLLPLALIAAAVVIAAVIIFLNMKYLWDKIVG